MRQRMIGLMSDGKSKNPPSEIPVQIFGVFLTELKKAGISEGVLHRLRTVMIEERNLTENALRTAIFLDSQNP